MRWEKKSRLEKWKSLQRQIAEDRRRMNEALRRQGWPEKNDSSW